MNLLHLSQLPVVPVVIVQDPMPVDLGSHDRGSPAEEADKVRSMGDGLHRPEHHLPRLWRRRFHPGIPSIGAGLLLHDTEVRADGTYLRQVQTPLPVIQAIRILRVCLQAIREIRIRIVSINVQCLIGHAMVVHPVKHAVCGDKVAGLQVFAQQITLHTAEADHAFRDKTVIVQNLMGIGGIVNRRPRHMDLIPCGIRLVPEYGSPGFIQRLDGMVFFFQEHAERSGIAFRIKLAGLAVQLVINLPADDSRMLCVMLAEFFYNPAGQLPVLRGIVIIVPPHAMAVEHAVHPGIQDLRIFLSQPRRRGGGWRSKDHLHPGRMGCIEEIIKEIIGKCTLCRLHLVPGEFPHTDRLNAGFQHPPKIIFPQLPVPMLRVITGAEVQAFPGIVLFFSHDRYSVNRRKSAVGRRSTRSSLILSPFSLTYSPSRTRALLPPPSRPRA